ncbi:MAG: PKD domain-containing protein, partial [Anaerolineae bacterium]
GMLIAAYTIGALQKGADTLASFSSRGPVTRDGSNRRKPDLTAPGTSIRSAWRGGGYSFSQGTSMATPHVAGAVALLWSAVPSLTGHITATESYLNAAAVPIPSTACGSLAGHPNNLYGYGRLDVLAAVKAAQADFNFPPTADFDFSAPVYVGKTAVFTNLSTGTPPLTSTWNFGDGPLSFGGGTALLPVQHTFIAAGSHTVSLTMTNSLGQSTARHPVMVYRAGVALSPAAAARSGPYNTPLTFTLRLTNTGDLTDTFRLALEGAGRFTGAAPTATHISLLPLAGTRLTVEVSFPFSGTLPLPLTTVVTAASLGDPGRVATATLISLFTNIPDSPPTAAFTYTHYTSDTYPILVNQPATFINLTTGTLPITSTWDFGDGTPGVTIGTAFFPVQHTYAAFGSYTVTLTVTNKFGENVYADTITVTALNWMYLPLVLK